ncbi:hypothetical protein NSA50_18020 [Clostridium sp. DSM 100503]|uniref:hypothetical protein n=1 Tax=Clostridium sp. DSM 100503 TaxID=2963282 RepID=UPI00214A677A|nr:hypothetical protein [Clostridium sp. DSM 100503]MCR1952902.1 hypothetical protein [Clostridium sp. DSM 100503]
MRKVIVPAYNYDEENNTVVDRYICSECLEIVKEEKRIVRKRKGRKNSVLYYVICSKCNNKIKK